MDKVKVICSRCGQECVEGSAYYKIDIYGYDTNPTNDGRVSLNAATQNIITNYNKILGNESHYCQKCKDEILQFMQGDKKVEEPNSIFKTVSEIIDRYTNKDK